MPGHSWSRAVVARGLVAVSASFGALSLCATASAQTPVIIDDPPLARPVQEKTVTTVERPTEIRSWKGIGAFSVYDKEAGVYRLAISRVGSKPEIVPVAPRSVAFDADVGPDTKGLAAIVYSRCEREPDARGRGREDCDIYRYSITRNVESKITNADSDAASEFNPTIWDGRVAWVRTYDRRSTERPYVYTRELTAPRSRRSQQLPGLPTRRCDGPDGRCAATRGAVEGLELYGRWVALNVRYDYQGNGGLCGRKEVRLDTLDGDVRQIADMTCGLNGQSQIGLSFDEGRLYWARYCVASPGGCRNSGAWRYRLSTGDYALARYGRRLTGFSYVDDGRAYEVRAPDERNGYCGNSIEGDADQPLCTVVYTGPLDFRSTDAPR